MRGLCDCWLLPRPACLTGALGRLGWAGAVLEPRADGQQEECEAVAQQRTAKPDKKPDFIYKCLFQFMVPYLCLQCSA